MRAARRWRRVVMAFGALVLLVGIGAALVSQTAAFREWVRREVVARANRALAGRLAVGRIDGNLFGRLVATDVRLVLDDARVLAPIAEAGGEPSRVGIAEHVRANKILPTGREPRSSGAISNSFEVARSGTSP